jgi:hypothetical protein
MAKRNDAHAYNGDHEISSQRLAQQRQTRDEQYEILTSAAILDRMQKLVSNFPNFVTLTTTQEWFGLPRAGECH